LNPASTRAVIEDITTSWLDSNHAALPDGVARRTEGSTVKSPTPNTAVKLPVKDQPAATA
jgi:hypothetical protein